jgi:hypothetical protein
MEPEISLPCSRHTATGFIQSQTNPVYILPTYLFKIQSNIILPFTPRSSEWSLPFRFTDQNFAYIYNLAHAWLCYC